MAKQFDKDEWKKINAKLKSADKASARAKAKTDKTLAAFGLPERRDNSIVMASWNIRKFGKDNGRTDEARALYAEFASRCDLIALQEVMDDMFSLRDLLSRLQKKVPSADYRILSSDVTGRRLDGRGLGERLAFIYDANRIQHTEVASDISFDRSQIIKNVNASLDKLRNTTVEKLGPGTMAERTNRFFNTVTEWAGFNSEKLNDFFDFIRAPHYATFDVLGKGSKYEVAVVNAHLHYGKSKQREKEFMMLLEWIFLKAKKASEAPITMIIGDLNLDFGKNNAERREVIYAFLEEENGSGRNKVDANFPFLEKHPIQDELKTNIRQTESFDQIAYFHRDPRLPLTKHNQLAGTSTEDFFDFGMFNFVELFEAAGVIEPGADGLFDYTDFEHDVSDHMPIWVRMPIPEKDQWTFDQLP